MSKMIVGFAKSDITPEIGSPYYVGQKIKVVESPIMVSVIYLKASGELPVILISVDVGAVDKVSDAKFRRAVSDRTNVPFERIRISATHNHAGPDIDWSIQELLDELGLDLVSKRWIASIEPVFAETAAEAIKNSCPATAYIAEDVVDAVGANKSVYGESRPVSTRYGVAEEILRKAPDGVMDPDVTVLNFMDGENKNIVTIFNYACHLTSDNWRNGIMKAGFTSYAAEYIEEYTGGNAFFLQGAAGNVGTGKYTDGSFQMSKVLGRRLADAVIRALGYQEEMSSPIVFEHWTEKVELADCKPYQEIYEEFRSITADDDIDRAWTIASRLVAYKDWQNTEVSLFILGNKEWVMAGLPGESFAESALAIKGACPQSYKLIGAYFDCSLWYLPHAKYYRFGGYEASGGWNYVKSGTAEKIAFSVIQKINRL